MGDQAHERPGVIAGHGHVEGEEFGEERVSELFGDPLEGDPRDLFCDAPDRDGGFADSV
ncbi:hypothetical protein [Rhodococcus sp. IEGM 1307]|uniref:hypothetical protein n=1 Tax=Rhodococcus sp. IEGM 1307 TaxID=3047091 RepID=UPI0024B6E3A8|nr:hypothetical protein [Rhodococcus sp. IEGM 1307]MDI9979326.1 hypothetical protein [Rhodococcus sp. IEGM 1307]